MRLLYTASVLPRNLIITPIPLAVDFKSLLLRGLAYRRLWRGVRLSFVIGKRLRRSFIRLRLLTLLFLALRLMGALFRDGRSLTRRTAIACKTTTPTTRRSTG
ncbi:hypothetical protein V2W45_797553 [Cenococcum geophilum]